jgi:hypothetical protein
MRFKVKKPSPPSVKSAVKAVQKAAPRPASNAAKSVRSASSSAKKGASSIARGAQRMSKAAKPTPAKAAKAIKKNGGKVQALAAPGTRIRYREEIAKAGSRNRDTRINSRNSTTIRKLDPGRYVVRKRNSGKPSLNTPKKPSRINKIPPGMVLKAASALASQGNKSDEAIKSISRVAKMAGGGVNAMAAPATNIGKSPGLSGIGSRDRRRRTNTRNTLANSRLKPGKYLIRDRLRPSSGGLPKSPAARNLLNKAKKTFSNPGKPIAKAVKSPKKALSKKIKAASKAKVQFPKNVKGPKATCPLLKQKGLKQSNAMFKAPKLSMPKSKVKAGAVIGGAIGAMVGGVPGAVIGAAIGAGVGRVQELNKPKIINRRTPKKEPPYGGPQPIDKDIKRLQELAKVPRKKRSKDQNAELCKLLGSIGPDPDFAVKDKENQDRLERSLQKLVKEDKEVAEANKNWQKLSDKQKSSVAEKILKAQRDSYNPTMSAPTFTTFNEPFKPASDGRKYILNGDYNHSNNRIRLNTHEDAKFGKNLESAANILCHEQAHRYQHVLVDMMNNGQITPSSPYYRQAQIWSANFDAYQSTGAGDSFACYEGQAVERHSHVAEDAAHAGI